MVAVVVDHQHAARLAAHLEAPVDAGEGGEALAGSRSKATLEVEADRHRGQRVQARCGRPEPPPSIGSERVARRAWPCSSSRSARAPRRARETLGLRREAVGHHAALDAGQDVLHRRVVEAQHRRAVERDLVHEAEERLLHVGQVVVGVEVLAVDVGDDGDAWA